MGKITVTAQRIGFAVEPVNDHEKVSTAACNAAKKLNLPFPDVDGPYINGVAGITFEADPEMAEEISKVLSVELGRFKLWRK